MTTEGSDREGRWRVGGYCFSVNLSLRLQAGQTMEWKVRLKDGRFSKCKGQMSKENAKEGEVERWRKRNKGNGN